MSAKKVRIIRIFSRLNIGGPAFHTILLSAALHNNKYETLLIKGVEDPFEGNMLNLAKEKKINFVTVPEMMRNISFLQDVRAVLKIYALMKKEKPHIIHTHTAKAGFLGRLAAWFYILQIILFSRERLKVRPRLVHTFHGHIFHGYFNPLTTKVFLLIERVFAQLTDSIITVSEKQREEIVALGIGGKKKVITVPLGLELKKFLSSNRLKGVFRKELGIGQETLLIGIVSRLVPIKNISLFLSAAEEFKGQNRERKVIFVIIGDGELRLELEAEARARHLSGVVNFLGFRHDLEKIYADLDICVLTSLNEGSPVALIEAMAAGRAVISTDVGGVADLFKDTVKSTGFSPESGGRSNAFTVKKGGVLVKSEDTKGLERAMTALGLNKNLRKTLGQEGRDLVWPKFDISRLTYDIKNIYDELLSDK